MEAISFRLLTSVTDMNGLTVLPYSALIPLSFFALHALVVSAEKNYSEKGIHRNLLYL